MLSIETKPSDHSIRPLLVSVRVGAMAAFPVGDAGRGDLEFVWAHGWGNTHAALLPLAQTMRHRARSWLLDLPGFGAAPPPTTAWSTADYADAAAEWLATLPPMPRIWIAHSFGTRIGLQLAARHPQSVHGLFLIAAAGLPPLRSPWQKAKLSARRLSFRLARQLTPEGPARDRLRERFGSADYRQAGATMRPILVRAVNENLSDVARAVQVPTVLVYGDRDRETPPDIGKRLQKLMPRSRLVVLRGFDHWDVLTEGRHQIVQRLNEFLEELG